MDFGRTGGAESLTAMSPPASVFTPNPQPPARCNTGNSDHKPPDPKSVSGRQTSYLLEGLKSPTRWEDPRVSPAPQLSCGPAGAPTGHGQGSGGGVRVVLANTRPPSRADSMGPPLSPPHPAQVPSGPTSWDSSPLRPRSQSTGRPHMSHILQPFNFPQSPPWAPGAGHTSTADTNPPCSHVPRTFSGKYSRLPGLSRASCVLRVIQKPLLDGPPIPPRAGWPTQEPTIPCQMPPPQDHGQLRRPPPQDHMQATHPHRARWPIQEPPH